MIPIIPKTAFRGHETGFTLVEILVALVLSTFILGVVAQVFLSGKSAFAEMQRFGQLQGEMRFVSDFLTRDIRGAESLSFASGELTVARTAGANGDRDCLGNAKAANEVIENIYRFDANLAAIVCESDGVTQPVLSRVTALQLVPVDGSLNNTPWDDALGVLVSVTIESGPPVAPRAHAFQFAIGLRNEIFASLNAI
jgi:hypothetical protein